MACNAQQGGLTIYLVGICGTGMGSLAGLLKSLGHRVRGSDEHIYPPMSEKLRDWGIEVLPGFDADHLYPPPDLVVVGNAIRAHNPEAVCARNCGIKTLSMPEALAEFGIGQRAALVVAGTHGKTTVTALAAHVLMQTGSNPSFLVGGALVGYPESFRTSSESKWFVVEGDEYDSAYFDKGPKFIHYRPKIAIITSLEYDHADIYPNIESMEVAFRSLVGKVPADGTLIVWHGAERARRLISSFARTSRVMTYAADPNSGADLCLKDLKCGAAGLSFEALLRGVSMGPIQVPLWGEFGAQNTLAVIGALTTIGLSAKEIKAGLASFQGVRRRLEVRGEIDGVTVVDDFGHHPTAILVTLTGARERWPGRYVWAVFEPRSATTRRNVFQDELVAAFENADRVIIAGHERLNEIPEPNRLDPVRLANDINQRGKIAHHVVEVTGIVKEILSAVRAGEVIIVFSNGSFGNLIEKLLAGLGQRAKLSKA